MCLSTDGGMLRRRFPNPIQKGLLTEGRAHGATVKPENLPFIKAGLFTIGKICYFMEQHRGQIRSRGAFNLIRTGEKTRHKANEPQKIKVTPNALGWE